MIGQRCVQQQIKSAIEAKTLARFIILAGERGSGRKTLAKEVAKWLGTEYAEVDKGVDAIREMIEDSYKITKPIMYVLDGDSMSAVAKSALLKVTEEPPNNVYFVFTITDANRVLDTLASRASIYRMDHYTENEISRFAGSEDWRFRYFCSNKYEVDLLLSYGIDTFHDFVKKVVDNIDVVDSANALKIEESLALKDSDSGKYDLKIFLQAFSTECFDRVRQFDEYPEYCPEKLKYLEWISITKKEQELLASTPLLNKVALMDIWIFDIRAVDYADRKE